MSHSYQRNKCSICWRLKNDLALNEYCFNVCALLIYHFSSKHTDIRALSFMGKAAPTDFKAHYTVFFMQINSARWIKCVCVCVSVCVLFFQGFEPRGTYIGVRQFSLTKLQENTGTGKPLSLLPPQLSDRPAGRYCTMQGFTQWVCTYQRT